MALKQLGDDSNDPENTGDSGRAPVPNPDDVTGAEGDDVDQATEDNRENEMNDGNRKSNERKYEEFQMSENEAGDFFEKENAKAARFVRVYCVSLMVFCIIVLVSFSVVVSVLFLGISDKVHHHIHNVEPNLVDLLHETLGEESLCQPCDEPTLDTYMYDVTHHPRGGNNEDGEDCCVSTPVTLLSSLELFVERKYRQEQAYSNMKIATNSNTKPGETIPAAHLMGSVRRPEQPTAPGRQFPIAHWINDTDLAYIHKVEYRHGRIVVLQPGLYYVYSQVAFLEVYDTDSSRQDGPPSLSHYLYRYNVGYRHGGEESLIQNSITKCWGRNQAFGEYSSYLGAVFQLRPGDELFVKVSNLSLIVREPKLNYFGLYKVN